MDVAKRIAAWGITLVCSFTFVLLFSVSTGLLFYQRWWVKLFTLRFYKGMRVILVGHASIDRGVDAAVCGNHLRHRVVVSVRRAADALDHGTHQGGGGQQRDGCEGFDTKPGQKPFRITRRGSKERRGWLSLVRCRNCCRWRSMRVLPRKRIRNCKFTRFISRSVSATPLQVQGPASAWLVTHAANMVRIDPYRGTVVSVRKGDELSAGIRWSVRPTRCISATLAVWRRNLSGSRLVWCCRA